MPFLADKMKKVTSILILFVLMVVPNVGTSQVTADGYAYLENQSEHSGIQVLFEMTAPNSLTDTSITDASGYFTAQLEIGIYNVSYSKDGYFSESLTNQSYTSNTTLSTITLIEHTTLINVPSLFSTIQSAINYSFSGDTILVQPNTYLENINYNGKSIVVGSLFMTTQDTSYISSTIIDGNQSGRVVYFGNGEGSGAKLIGLTIRNGSSGNGGGVYCYFSSPTLENVVLSDNYASSLGGGIACYRGSPTLTNVKIVGNSAYDGGGVSLRTLSNIVFIDVIISNNSATGSAGSGGGIWSTGGNSSLTNVIMSGNSVTNYTDQNNDDVANGGAIFCSQSTNMSLSNVTITDNYAGKGGGIACTQGGSLTIVNSIVSNNDGLYGIFASGGANPSINYCNIYSNGTSSNLYGTGSWLGVNTTVNANGDSCDLYYNIQEDPLFVDADNVSLYRCWRPILTIRPRWNHC